MKIHVTEKDLRCPCVTALHNPISLALRRETGDFWYVFDGSTIRRMIAPLEPISLPAQVSQWWHAYKGLRSVHPIEFEVDVTKKTV